MKILVVSDNYPSLENPARGTFVYNLIQQFCKLGHGVTVISPKSFLSKGAKKVESYGEENCTVYRPMMFSFSNRNILGFNTYLLGQKTAVESVKKVVTSQNLVFDVIYCHFLTNAIVAQRALGKFKKPIFAAIGEYDNLNVRRNYYSTSTYKKYLDNVSGFIAVSPKIKERLIEHGADKRKIIVEPNAVDFELFYPRRKEEMRIKYGLPLDKKLVIFVGRFLENKGPLRVLKAVECNQELGAIFVGGGPQKVEGKVVVFNKKVAREEVPELLSAADLFVLPTLHEGSCNAIVEAMACGLPIISSDIPEIQFQCDPSFSILVDPLDVKALESAIDSIISNENRRAEMSKNALQYSKNFEIGERAMSILNFIQGKSKE